MLASVAVLRSDVKTSVDCLFSRSRSWKCTASVLGVVVAGTTWNVAALRTLQLLAIELISHEGFEAVTTGGPVVSTVVVGTTFNNPAFTYRTGFIFETGKRAGPSVNDRVVNPGSLFRLTQKIHRK
jgi:hypothetical protein